jgi:arginyl-tRNA synthetase
LPVFKQKTAQTQDMTTEQTLQNTITRAIVSAFDLEVSASDISLQPTRKDFEGNYTFVVFPYVKTLKKSPADIGQAIGEYLKNNTEGLVIRYNVVQGFLNLVLSDSYWLDSFNTMLDNPNFGVAAPNGHKVMVEYSSPNTNKPLHLGHLRNNFLGFSVAEILKASGYEVRKTNIVNNRGIHICKSMLAYQKFGNGETPESANIKGDHLVGKYYVIFDKAYKVEIAELVEKGIPQEQAEKQAPLMLEAQEMLRKWEAGDKETLDLWNLMNTWVYAGFDATYKRMGVTFDKIYYESDTYLLGKSTVDEGLSKGVFYQKPDGSVWIDLTDEGLDQKLVLRADGTSVYITQDLGLSDMKFQDFQMDKSVYVVGNEQDYHFEVLFKIMKKLGRSYSNGLYHLSYGMVDLPSGKMKSREGTVVDADDLMQEMIDTAEATTKELGKIDGLSESQAQELYQMLALGALKYYLLKVEPKKRMLFNPQESIDFQGHTGPYIQYNHARICSILRKAAQLSIEVQAVDTTISLQKIEQELIFVLYQYPQVVADAARDYSPALVSQYAYTLAKTYSQFFSELSIFNESNDQIKAFRVSLSKLVADVLKKSMGLLGVGVPDKM